MPAETVWEFVRRPEYGTSPVKSRAVLDNILQILEERKAPTGLEEIRGLTGYSKDTVRPALYQLQKHYGAVKLVEVRGRTIVDINEIMQYSTVKNWLANLKPSESI